MAAGTVYSLFVKCDGTLWGMGDGSRFGHGFSAIRTPTILTNDVIAMGGGQGFSFYVKSDGSLWGMGDNSFGQVGAGPNVFSVPSPLQIVPSGVKAVAGGFFHTLFIKSDSSLWGMGDDLDGQLGDSSTHNNQFKAT